MEIHRHDLEIIWVTDYYDLPLRGLAKVDGKYCEFEFIYLEQFADYSDYYNCRILTKKECIMWLLNKKTFELFVGKHFSYTNGKHRDSRQTLRHPILQKIYFKYLSNLWKKNTIC